MTALTYDGFLREKVNFNSACGFTADPDAINPVLKPHQKAIVQWAVQGGRRAIFAAFGLGKGSIQLETVRLILARESGKGLIICPLGVRQEFVRDATQLLGMAAPTFIRRNEDIDGDGIYLTNYESVRDGKLDPNLFTVVSLDEASVLRSFGSLTYQTFLTLFNDVPYKFVATATPSPNRYKELIHYAAFLGIMDSGQSLTRFFQRDSTKANNLTLYPHKEREFYLWLNTWACFIQKPSDLGFDDTGYSLPPLEVVYHEVAVDHSTAPAGRDGQAPLFRGAALGVSDAAQEKRDTLPARVTKAAEIVNEAPGDHFILWHDLEDERRALKAALPDSVEIYGSLDLEIREQRIVDFSDGKHRLLLTKPILSGSGCNFQRHCHRAIFNGIGFKFNDFYQAIHRIYRFLQTEHVRIDIIHAESEREVVRTIQQKWKQHEELTAKMTDVIREYGLDQASINAALTRSIGVERVEASGRGWCVARNDCVLETQDMEADSVDLIVTSIPFCYDETTEVLTRRGWLTFDRVTLDDDVATVHPTGQHLEWQRPTRRVWEPYDGQMIHFTGRSFDHLVTPNHRMYAARRGSRAGAVGMELVDAETITQAYEKAQRRTQDDGRILRSWRTCLVPPRRGDGKRPETITIPPLPDAVRTGHGVQLYWVETEDLMRLAGWYLSEGHADSFTESRAGGRISIAQTAANPEYRDEIQALLLRIGLPPSIHQYQLSVWCRNLAWFLREEFGHGAAGKRIPAWVKDLHPDLLEILRDTMMKGDGSKTLASYASISPQLRDDFQEICLATGWRAALTSGKVIQLGQTQLFPEIRETPNRVHYSGMIGCLTVPNHTLIVRRNGKAFVSGNSNHYEYTPAVEDFGHTDNNDHFWAQMDYLTPELLRVLRPGREYCCHVKDRILFGSVTGAGAPTVSPFHAEAIMHGRKHGFDYMGMITVVTDVVRENNQTYRLGWTENSKDSTKMGVGSPEYILIFRKPQTDRSKGYADVPVTKDKTVYTRARWQTDAHAFYRSSGNRHLTPEELSTLPADQMSALFTNQTLHEIYDYEDHVTTGEALEARGALPATFMSLAPGSHHPDVWHDINRMDTLNAEQSRRAQQFHVCPLQLDLIKRLIVRYSNPGDLIYDPFGGLFSVPLVAIQNGRTGRGVELNPDYYRDGVAYLRAQEQKQNLPTLFDLEGLAS